MSHSDIFHAVHREQPIPPPSSPQDSPPVHIPPFDEIISLSSHPSIRSRLYLSHFLSTWNSRLFEFGAVLFLASIFPHTLLPASVYALVRAAAAIVLAPYVGRWVDSGERLGVVRASIVGQRVAVATSCLGLWVLAARPSLPRSVKTAVLVFLVLLACVEKLCSIMNLVAIERDWVVVIAEDDKAALQTMNSQMRRIDLFCKLVGPLAIALIDGFSTTAAILGTFGLNMVSILIEYFSIAKVYEMVPILQDRLTLEVRDTIDLSKLSQTWLVWMRSSLAGLRFYIYHSAFLPSLSLSLLYLTVLSFGGQMVTYLFSAGYTSTQIGLVRTVSVAFEMSATWIAPMVMSRIGPVRSGIWFINWQIVSLVIAVSIFWFTQSGLLATSGLVAGVILSRVGLWGFDLSVQIIVQDEVEESSRGNFSSFETSFQNAFELLSFLSTIIFSRPEQFRYPALVSASAVITAGFLYAAFVRKRRGHLLHASRCFNSKERHGGRGGLIWSDRSDWRGRYARIDEGD